MQADAGHHTVPCCKTCHTVIIGGFMAKKIVPLPGNDFREREGSVCPPCMAESLWQPVVRA